MARLVTLQLPDETLQRCQRGATAARKRLEEFLVERLLEAIPPLADNLPSPLQEKLKVLEALSDESLWQVARSQLPPASQRRYSRLLAQNRQGTLPAEERDLLHTLGAEARLLAWNKAHASLLLSWRGHRMPSPEELPRPG